jgi:hypothetical protein
MEVSGQLHAPDALPPRKDPQAPIGWLIGWASELAWTMWSTEKSLAPPGNGTPVVQRVAIPTEMSRLPLCSKACSKEWEIFLFLVLASLAAHEHFVTSSGGRDYQLHRLRPTEYAFYLRTETESSIRKVVFKSKEFGRWMMSKNP